MKNHVGYELFMGRRLAGRGWAFDPVGVEVRPGAVAVVMMDLLDMAAGPGRRPGPADDQLGLPALEPELLGLLDHVRIVLGGTVGGRGDAGAHGDGDLLERRS